MGQFTPTPEQAIIRDAFTAGESVTIVAAAGSGKTTSLQMLAEADRNRRGLYVAYNRAIADDAKTSFPASTLCATAHSLAYRAIGHRYRGRLNSPRVPAAQAARILKVNDLIRVDGDRVLQPKQIVRLAMETVGRFCYSAEPEIQPWHVPTVPGCEERWQRQVVRDAITPVARRAWTDLIQVDGQLRFTHDMYLKIWSLSQPQLPYDYILFDEAQDANPAVLSVVQAQLSAQLVPVGDPCQAIYGWRGAIDAMDQFKTDTRLHLSKSFRFGPRVAAEANKWLAILGAELRVEGFERLNSVVVNGTLTSPDAILCRTNSAAIAQVMTAVDAGRRVALVGGGNEMLRMAEAAVGLKAGIGTDHPELCMFTTWGQVQDYAEEDAAGADLKVFVKLIDEHGPDKVIDTLHRLTRSEDRADVIVSTAHKAKGREWGAVQVAGDFKAPQAKDDGSQGEIQREEAMLAYVTTTRAKLTLDRAGLAWVDHYLTTRAAAA
jgi:superfamily I DNA/RNA helicase